MKIALLGYGKMGKEIESIANQRGHEVVVKFDKEEDWLADKEQLEGVDVAIEFTAPNSVVKNIFKCFDADVPVVVGTTGWMGQLDHVKEICREHNKTLFYASNFSIGVNLFFKMNEMLAKMMTDHEEYEVSIDETHHTEKLDSPSGTAIRLADDIADNMERKDLWVKGDASKTYEIGVHSHRIDQTPGTHVVRYTSEIDDIEIKHVAKSRVGFAKGAVLAAEWVNGRKGLYTMDDLLKDVNFAGFWQ